MRENTEIRFRLTSEQHDRIKKQADKAGWTIKQYIINVALNSEVTLAIKTK